MAVGALVHAKVNRSATLNLLDAIARSLSRWIAGFGAGVHGWMVAERPARSKFFLAHGLSGTSRKFRGASSFSGTGLARGGRAVGAAGREWARASPSQLCSDCTRVFVCDYRMMRTMDWSASIRHEATRITRAISPTHFIRAFQRRFSRPRSWRCRHFPRRIS